MSRLSFFSAAAVLSGVVLAGCSVIETKSDPSRFYVLEPAATERAPEASWPFALAVARVRIPDYLDRPQIVTRTEGARVTYSEFHRWPEPLDRASTRTFAESLAARIGATRVAREPSLDIYRDAVCVQLDAVRFDGELGGEVTLRARWRAYSVATGDTLAGGERTVTVKSEASGYDAYVRALASALDRFAAEASGEIRSAVKASEKGLPVSVK